MNRYRPLGLVALVLLAAVAIWALAGGSEPTDELRSADRRGEVGGGAGSVPERGGSGVGRRGSDSSAAAKVLGTVVDEDGQPVDHGNLVLSCLEPGSRVRRIDGGVLRLGEDGSFEGPGCRYDVCVALSHPYLVPADPWVLHAGQAAELTARELPRLHGRVVDASGEAVPAANVTFTPPRSEDVDPRAALPLMTRATTTDDDGRFSVAWIERPPCDPCQEATGGCESDALTTLDAFVVSVRASRLGPVERLVAVEDAEAFGVEDPLTLVTPHSGDILSGRLVDGSGYAYPRAYVLARSVARPSEQRRAHVEGENFEFDGLGEGAYDLRALQDGVELARAPGVSAGDDVVMTGDLAAVGPNVQVVVLDERGRPVRARLDGGPFRDAATDARGRAVASQVLPGELSLRIRIPGRAAFMHTISVPDRRADAPGAEPGAGARADDPPEIFEVRAPAPA